MVSTLCLVLIILINISYLVISTSEIQVKKIQQPLDHFSASNNYTFDVFYYEKLTHWKEKGPILLYIGGENGVDNWTLNNSAVVKLAKETNAAIFALEHRYFGKSKPNLSGVGAKRYKYLNIAQALADVANFVRIVKDDGRFVNSKVVAIGISYSGCLASWVRQKYPDLIDAAWASSAPVLAKLDFREAFEHVGNMYRRFGDKNCYENIEKLFKYVDFLFKTNNTEQLKREQNICNHVDLTEEMSKYIFFHILTAHFYKSQSVPSVLEVCRQISDFDAAKIKYHSIGCQNSKKSRRNKRRFHAWRLIEAKKNTKISDRRYETTTDNNIETSHDDESEQYRRINNAKALNYQSTHESIDSAEHLRAMQIDSDVSSNVTSKDNNFSNKTKRSGKVQSLEHICENPYKKECDPRRFEYNLGPDPAWEWITCSELGYFTTTNSEMQPFGSNNPLEYFVKRCQHFGEEFTQDFINSRIDDTNKEYGGLKPTVTKVIYVNGALDLWHKLGITSDLNDDTPAIFLKNHQHGDDLQYLRRNKNSVEIIADRRKIIRIIKRWIMI